MTQRVPVVEADAVEGQPVAKCACGYPHRMTLLTVLPYGNASEEGLLGLTPSRQARSQRTSRSATPEPPHVATITAAATTPRSARSRRTRTQPPPEASIQAAIHIGAALQHLDTATSSASTLGTSNEDSRQLKGALGDLRGRLHKANTSLQSSALATLATANADDEEEEGQSSENSEEAYREARLTPHLLSRRRSSKRPVAGADHHHSSAVDAGPRATVAVALDLGTPAPPAAVPPSSSHPVLPAAPPTRTAADKRSIDTAEAVPIAVVVSDAETAPSARRPRVGKSWRQLSTQLRDDVAASDGNQPPMAVIEEEPAHAEAQSSSTSLVVTPRSGLSKRRSSPSPPTHVAAPEVVDQRQEEELSGPKRTASGRVVPAELRGESVLTDSPPESPRATVQPSPPLPQHLQPPAPPPPLPQPASDHGPTQTTAGEELGPMANWGFPSLLDGSSSPPPEEEDSPSPPIPQAISTSSTPSQAPTESTRAARRRRHDGGHASPLQPPESSTDRETSVSIQETSSFSGTDHLQQQQRGKRAPQTGTRKPTAVRHPSVRASASPSSSRRGLPPPPPSSFYLPGNSTSMMIPVVGTPRHGSGVSASSPSASVTSRSRTRSWKTLVPPRDDGRRSVADAVPLRHADLYRATEIVHRELELNPSPLRRSDVPPFRF